MKSLIRLRVVAAAALVLNGCVSTDQRAERRDARMPVAAVPEPAAEAPRYWWNGEGASGNPRIKISLGEQRAYFYKGGELVGVTPVSTGREGYRTPAGSFKVLDKTPRHISTLYGKYVDSEGNTVRSDVDVRKHPKPPGARFEGAPMPYFIRFNGGIGTHAGYVPDYPASHGCIRLPREMAEHFYAHAPVGTPVQVVR